MSASYINLLLYLKYIAVIIFVILGINLIKNQDSNIKSEDIKFHKKSELAGFTAGLLVIIGNPKAALFYLGILPGFFNLTELTLIDCAAIALVSALIPFIGNLALAVMIEKSRAILKSPSAMKKLNTLSGCLLIFVGLLIFFDAYKSHL